MAISLGTPTNSGNGANVSSRTFSHTTAANTKCLVVVVTGYDSSATDSVVNSVVFNTTESLTEIAGGRYRVGSAFESIWYLSNPSITTANVVVTMAGTCTDVQATAIGLIDASATAITYDSYDTGTGTGSASAVISPARPGSYAVGGGVAVGGTASSLSVSAGSEISGSEVDMGSQTASCATAATSGGSATMTWTYSAVVCSALGATFYSYITYTNVNSVKAYINAPTTKVNSIKANLVTARYWVGNGGYWDDTSHWSTSSGGSSGASAPSSSQDAIFDQNSFSSTGQTVYISSGSTAATCLSVRWTYVTNSPTWNFNYNITISGSMILSSGMSVAQAGYQLGMNYSGGGTVFVLCAGNYIPINFNISLGSTSTLKFVDDFKFIKTGINFIYFNSGIWDTNGFDVDCNAISSTGSSTRTLNMNDSTFSLSGKWEFNGATNCTINPGTSTIVMQTGGYGSGEFKGNAYTYNNLTISTVDTTVTYANTFNVITIEAGRTLTLPASTTTTIQSIVSNGTSGSNAYLYSSSSGTQATISDSAGTNSVSYLQIRDSAATGGALFIPDSTCTDLSNNTGWIWTKTKVNYVVGCMAGPPATTQVNSAKGYIKGLLSWWKMDDGSGSTINDYANGSKYDLTNNNTTYLQWDATDSPVLPGHVTYSSVLKNESSTYASGRAYNNSFPNYIKDFTVQFRIKPLGYDDNQGIIGKSVENTFGVTDGWRIRHEGTSSQFGRLSFIASETGEVGEELSVLTDNILPKNIWNDVAVIWEGGTSHRVRIYINGHKVIDDNTTFSGDFVPNTNAPLIVSAEINVNTYVRAIYSKISDIKFYNYALDDTTIMDNAGPEYSLFQYAKGHIQTTYSKVNLVKSNVLQAGQSPNSAKGNILYANNTKLNITKANIFTSYLNTSKANIIVKNGPYYEINLVPDPSFENSTSLWTNVYGSGGTGSRVNYWASEGTWQWIIQSSGYNWYEYILRADGLVLKAGKTYTISATVMTDWSGQYDRVFRFQEVGGAGMWTVGYTLNSYTYYRVTTEFTPTVDCYLYFNPLPQTWGTQAMWYDAVLVEEGTGTTYFDGDYIPAAWLGTQDASPSAKGGQRNYTKANIILTTTKINYAKASIYVSNANVNSVKADILVTDNVKVVYAKASIFITYTNVNSAKANLYTIVSSVNTVKANIFVIGNTKVNVSKANIVVSNSFNSVLKANLKNTYTADNYVKADIRTTYTKVNFAKASIYTTGTQLNYAKGNILRIDNTKLNCAKASLVVTQNNTNNVKSNIKASIYYDTYVKANIRVNNNTKENYIKANLSYTFSDVNYVKANILVNNNTIINYAKGYILITTTTKVNHVKANIVWVGITNLNTTKANVKQVFSNVNYAKGNILNVGSSINYSKANIKQTYSVLNYVKANIPAQIICIFKANIIGTYSKINFVTGNINTTGQQVNSSKANILVENSTKDCYVIAAIDWPVISSNQVIDGNLYWSKHMMAIAPDGTIYYTERLNEGIGERIYVRYSTNGGYDWQTLGGPADNNAGYLVNHPTVAIDSTGKPHVVFEGYDATHSVNYAVFYSKWNGASWDHETIEYDTNYDMDNPVIAIDSNDIPHVIASGFSASYTQAKAYYSNRIGGTWSAWSLVAADQGDHMEDMIDIVIDGNDTIHAVWWFDLGSPSNDEQIVYSYKTSGGSWQPSEIIFNESILDMYPWYPTITRDASNNIYVALCSYPENGGDWYVDMYYLKKTSSGWSAPITVYDGNATNGDVGTNVTATTNGIDVWFFWDIYTNNNDSKIMYKKLSGGTTLDTNPTTFVVHKHQSPNAPQYIPYGTSRVGVAADKIRQPRRNFWMFFDVETIQVQFVKANILVSENTKVNLSKANIITLETKLNYAKASINTSGQSLNYAKGNIKNTYTNSNSAKGQVVWKQSQINIAKANLLQTYTNINTAKGNLKQTRENINTVKANILYLAYTAVNISKANIKTSYTSTQSVKASILQLCTQINLTKANIPAERINSAKGNIGTTYTKINYVKGFIFSTGFQVHYVKANLKQSYDQISYAKGQVVYHQATSCVVKANILQGSSASQSTKANILRTPTDVNYTKANIVVTVIQPRDSGVDYALYFDGDDDVAQNTDGHNFISRNTDFTVDFLYTHQYNGNPTDDVSLMTSDSEGSAASNFYLRLRTNGLFQAYMRYGGTCAFVNDPESSRTWVQNQTYHISIMRRASDNMYWFSVDGTLSSGVNMPDGNPDGYYNNFFLGSTYFGKGKFIIDELRISKVLRWTDNFDPPTAPYESDINTVALYHFGQGSGSVIEDSSSNGWDLTFKSGTYPTWVTGLFDGLGYFTKANILVNGNTNNNSVKASIKSTESKLNSTKANFKNTYDETQSVKANILASSSYINEVKAFISLIAEQDNSSLGNILRAYEKINYVKAFIFSTGYNINSAKANITHYYDAICYAKANIVITPTSVVYSKANITTVYSVFNYVKASIITVGNTSTCFAKANITRSYENTNVVKGNIKQSISDINSVKANILFTGNTDTQFVKANIWNSVSNINYVRANLWIAPIYVNYAKAYIFSANINWINYSKANISSAGNVVSNYAKADIWKSVDFENDIKANILVIEGKINSVRANILESYEYVEYIKASIVQTVSYINFSRGDIIRSYDYVNSSKAYLIPIAINYSKGNILGIITQINDVKGNIVISAINYVNYVRAHLKKRGKIYRGRPYETKETPFYDYKVGIYTPKKSELV